MQEFNLISFQPINPSPYSLLILLIVSFLSVGFFLLMKRKHGYNIVF
jgi:hypothetical protein